MEELLWGLLVALREGVCGGRLQRDLGSICYSIRKLSWTRVVEHGRTDLIASATHGCLRYCERMEMRLEVVPGNLSTRDLGADLELFGAASLRSAKL